MRPDRRHRRGYFVTGGDILPSEYQKSSLEDHRKMKTCKIGKIENYCSRETLHVHSARHGRARNLKLHTLIALVMNYKSAKFHED